MTHQERLQMFRAIAESMPFSGGTEPAQLMMVTAPKRCVSASVVSLDQTYRYTRFEEEKKSKLLGLAL